ncbi:DUF3908 family protein [Priestia endophytica]|uniref:Uncharacterized protein n=1 Tax=Priestia endophytica TaxID=135735 RepID=A0AAX1Q5Q5_9BACI|nr:DUF3908 family protein [Priestia endophytica]RAS75230.1 hypothetical protein A3864_16320 [Priestia endophytica]
MRKMTFELFQQAYGQLGINNEPAENMIEDLLDFMGNLDEVKNHDIFYPQGMFNDKELNLFFITKFTVTMIEVGNSPRITTWKTKEIYSCELTVLSRYSLQLKINFKDGKVVELNSETDTNSTWAPRFKEEILDIYKLLNF